MKIQENISLKPFNTFGIDKKAYFFGIAQTMDDLREGILKAKEMKIPLVILGGGSNILLTKDLNALVMKIEINGIKLIEDNENEVKVEVGAGENWHAFVLHCIANGWGGVENLSLIPGTVGASPMQNIGAYGVELKDVFQELKAIDRESKIVKTFLWEDCKFGYRESVFKNDFKDRFIITHVVFKLQKKPLFHVEYGTIGQTLAEMGVKELSLEAISSAVVRIRQSKLPDPKIIGNAGSFFKNPTIPNVQFEKIKHEYPDIPGFPMESGIKIPAAWLIEQAGWKGKTFGSIGVHKLQPLVLVNYGNGDGNQIKELSQKIQESILQQFDILLQPEVNFL